MILISLYSSTNDPNVFDNGIDLRSRNLMNDALFDAIEKNMRKKIKSLTDDQFIEILEQSVEFQELNYDLAKKTNLRDLIKCKIENKPISDKFRDIELEIEDKIPKLTCALKMMFASTEFMIELTEFAADSNCKVIYTLDMLMS